MVCELSCEVVRGVRANSVDAGPTTSSPPQDCQSSRGSFYGSMQAAGLSVYL